MDVIWFFSNLLGLFKKKDDEHKKHIPIYEDYDTEEDEDLDMTPPWMKDPLGNKKVILDNNLESIYPLPKKLKKIPLWFGTARS